MKKTIILSIFWLIALQYPLLSQWESDMRLTNNNNNSFPAYNNTKTICSNGAILHTVWADERDGNAEVYYKRSLNSGVSWEADVRLTSSAGSSYFPAIHVSGSMILVAWSDNRDGNFEIYFKRSEDGGSTWSTDTRLTSNTSGSDYPSIAASGSVVIIVWQDLRDTDYEIYFKRSTNGGISWGADQRVSNNTAFSQYPSVTISGAKVNIAWEDNRDGNREIYNRYSNDDGVTWSGENRLTNNSSPSTSVSVTSEGDLVCLTWSDQRDGNWEIYCKYSINGGASFSTDQRLTNANGNSWYPSIAADDSFIHICWQDARDGNNEIYYKLSTDGGTTWLADSRLTNNGSASGFPSVNVSGSALHIVWNDNRDGNTEIYYKRNPNGNPIGITAVSNVIPAEYSLGQNYPNPFNPMTNITIQLPKSGSVKLSVFDAAGKEVGLPVNKELNAGTYNIDFDASGLPSGVYFYRLQTAEFTETKKMMLIK